VEQAARQSREAAAPEITDRERVAVEHGRREAAAEIEKGGSAPGGGVADLGVEHDGAEDPGAVHGGAEVVERLLVVLVGAVGEVEARDAHAGAQQARDHLDGARGRAERADDLGLGPAPPRGRLPPRRLAARRRRRRHR